MEQVLTSFFLFVNEHTYVWFGVIVLTGLLFLCWLIVCMLIDDGEEEDDEPVREPSALMLAGLLASFSLFGLCIVCHPIFGLQTRFIG